MKVETNNLITVNTYSKKYGKSLTWAYNQIKNGSVKFVVIDNIKFVITK